MRICIVADNVSARFGGEAILPLHYFRLLRQRGIEVWLVAHDRVRVELEALIPEQRERMRFVKDTSIHRVLFRLSGLLPRRIAESTVGLIMLMYTQWTQRGVVRRLIREHGIDILHQPAPVAPSYPSMFFAMGRPLIIGPMNGGMDYPAAFRSTDSLLSRIFVGARASAHGSRQPGIAGKTKRRRAPRCQSTDSRRAAGRIPRPDGGAGRERR
jgi:hypothetical protein